MRPLRRTASYLSPLSSLPWPFLDLLVQFFPSSTPHTQAQWGLHSTGLQGPFLVCLLFHSP